jgi:hypothetical protein
MVRFVMLAATFGFPSCRQSLSRLFDASRTPAPTLEFQSIDENTRRTARASMGSDWEQHVIYWQTPDGIGATIRS